MKTKVLLLGSGVEPSMLHSRIIDTLEHSPEHLIIYINQDAVDTIKGLDYDCVILDELVNLGCIEQARGITTIKSGNVNVGTIGHPDWHYDPAKLVQVDGCMGIANKKLSSKIETKHTKPFYHKGRW